MLKKPNPRLKIPEIEKPTPVKCVVVGASNVGKTAMLESYCKGTFSDSIEPTIGSDFFTYTGKFNSKLY